MSDIMIPKNRIFGDTPYGFFTYGGFTITKVIHIYLNPSFNWTNNNIYDVIICFYKVLGLVNYIEYTLIQQCIHFTNITLKHKVIQSQYPLFFN